MKTILLLIVTLNLSAFSLCEIAINDYNANFKQLKQKHNIKSTCDRVDHNLETMLKECPMPYEQYKTISYIKSSIAIQCERR